MSERCSDLIDSKLLERMDWNSGYGPEDSGVCIEMANRFEAWLERTWSMTPRKLRGQHPSYELRREFVEKWIDFLRGCRGFYVVEMAFCSLIFPLAFFNTPWHRVRANAHGNENKLLPFTGLVPHANCPQEVAA